MAQQTDQPEAMVSEIIDATLEQIYEAFKREERVNIRNFGTFYLDVRRSGTVFKFNPAQRLRMQAAVRELREETGLEAYRAISLFRYRSQKNDHTVYYVKASGTPKLHEADYIGYYKNSQITGAIDGLPTYSTDQLTNSARAIIGLYQQLRKDNAAWFEALDKTPKLKHYDYQQPSPPLADD